MVEQYLEGFDPSSDAPDLHGSDKSSCGQAGLADLHVELVLQQRSLEDEPREGQDLHRDFADLPTKKLTLEPSLLSYRTSKVAFIRALAALTMVRYPLTGRFSNK